MAKATKFSDQAHARIYSRWRGYPAWKTLSTTARALLTEILLENRPGLNGKLSWPCRKAARAIGVSKATAARALSELEDKGWITCERVALFGKSKAPALYAVTMFANDANGDPPSRAYELWTPTSPLFRNRLTVSPQGHNGLTRGTGQSHQRDTRRDLRSPVSVSENLKSSKAFKGFGGGSKAAE